MVAAIGTNGPEMHGTTIIGKTHGADKIEDASKKLANIEALCKLHAEIRRDPHRTFALTWKDADVTQLQQCLSLYTSDVKERESSEQRNIYKPLLNILSDIGDECLKRTGGAKLFVLFRYLKLPEVQNECAGLIQVAMQDIFKDKTAALTDITAALKELKLTKNGDKTLNSSPFDTLLRCRKLAGFFYDKKAVEYLIRISECIPEHFLSASDWRIKLAILRFLQVTGEFSEHLSPSTLTLDKDIPDAKYLRKLRHKVSHLSRSQLDNLLGTVPGDDIFEEVRSNSLMLRHGFLTIQMEYTDWLQNLDVKSLWQKLKDLPDERKEPCSRIFNGLEWLLELSTAPSDSRTSTAPSNSGNPSYESEIKELLPFSVESHEVDGIEMYMNQRVNLIAILGKAKTKSYLPTELHEDLKTGALKYKAEIREITIEDCNAFQEKSIRLNEEIGLLREQKPDVVSDKEGELFEHKNDFLNEIMGISRDEHERRQSKQTEIDKIKEKRRTLAAKLGTTRPCLGLENISKIYADFLETLEEFGVPIENSERDYSWLIEPTSKIENLFHKVHKTNIVKKTDKDKVRKEKIQKLLDFIGFLRAKVGIETDLALNVKKEALWRTLQGMAKQTALAERSLKPRQEEATQKVKELQDYFLVAERRLTNMTPKDADKMLRDEEEILKETLTNLKKYLTAKRFVKGFDWKSWWEDLENSANRTCYCQLSLCIKFGNVKNNYRLHAPLPVTEKLIENLKYDRISFPAYEFLVAAIYEMLKEIDDYPELSCLNDTARIRNHFFHTNPFISELMKANVNQDVEGVTYPNDPYGELAKEIAILSVNVKFLLEIVAHHLDSTPT